MSSIFSVCFTLPPFHSSTFKRLQAASTLRHLRSIQVMRYDFHVQRVFHPSTLPLLSGYKPLPLCVICVPTKTPADQRPTGVDVLYARQADKILPAAHSGVT